MAMGWRKISGLFIAVSAIAACNGQQKSSESSSPSASSTSFQGGSSGSTGDFEIRNWLARWTGGDWEKREWVTRVVRILRGGSESITTAELDRFASLPKEQIIDELMAQPLFGDFVLDFNLFWMGFKPNQLRNAQGRLGVGLGQFSLESYPQAIFSAQETLRDGDHLKLFELYPPLYVLPLDPYNPAITDLTQPTPTPIPESERPEMRTRMVSDGLAILRPLLTRLQDPNVNFDKTEYCQSNVMGLTGFQFLQNIFTFRFDLVFALEFGDGRGESIQSLCFSPTVRTRAEFIRSYELTIRGFEQLERKIRDLEADRYQVSYVSDIKSLDLTPDTAWGKPIAFRVTQALQLNNSSTNQNRKRAAYILKRFMCDDMAAIPVEDLPGHATGVHGSNGSCYACHYRLDPMAGFFKDRGQVFSDFSSAATIRFDDNADRDRMTYIQAWRAPAGSGRDWNIGFIRSLAQPRRNSYGESLEDLFAILRTAPEVRRCLVRRVVDYLVSPDQTVDTGYMDHLVEQYDQQLQASSSAIAFKKTLKALLLSETFRVQDPNPEECYDRRPGANPIAGVPCRVAGIFQKYCVSCHGPSSSASAAQIDFTSWVADADGKMAFSYEDPSGQPLTRAQQMAHIADRLNSTDVSRRMPFGRILPVTERHELLLWLERWGRE